ncbi:MAG: LysM peptidoglycan-binding domain-containing protein [Candidatus Promineifilaceae bacterium]
MLTRLNIRTHFPLTSFSLKVSPPLLILILLLLTACERQDPTITAVPSAAVPDLLATQNAANNSIVQSPEETVLPPTPTLAPTITPAPAYPGTPTPDPTRPGPSAGDVAPHIVAPGETLSYLAQLYNTSVENLMEANGLTEGDFLEIGQTVLVPSVAAVVGPNFKLIPDSELVYGPKAADFNTQNVLASFSGYVLGYQEEVEGRPLTGPQIIQLVADRFSVNPRLLVALLEYQSGWVTQPAPLDNGYPMGYVTSGYEGLYQQLAWAANLVNMGYYGRSEGGLLSFDVGVVQTVAFAPDINDGTGGVQLMLGGRPEISYEGWLQAVGPDGFFATYNRLFGNPFSYTVDPLWPSDLAQPQLELPFTNGESWYFTGGPHGGWAGGSAWAALDFAPGTDQLGCYISDYWVTAMAPGVVTRSDFGAVVVDLDGDGFAGTGWAILYMHLDSRERVPAGTYVQTGDRLGHPSCEGGFSNGTHTHLARTYNGRWVAADGSLPFEMGGWVSQGLGREYDGLLVRGDVVKEACECREEGNTITAD